MAKNFVIHNPLTGEPWTLHQEEKGFCFHDRNGIRVEWIPKVGCPFSHFSEFLGQGHFAKITHFTGWSALFDKATGMEIREI